MAEALSSRPDELTHPSHSPIECGVSTLVLAGQRESGDRHLIAEYDGGILVAVVDGLGHGDEAALASRRAVESLAARPNQSVISLMKHCHTELKGTRGAVMSLASINLREETVTWIGVGNVEAILIRSDLLSIPLHEHILIRGGVVGYNLPFLQATVIPISTGDVLIFKTDGVVGGFSDAFSPTESPQKIADRICTKNAKGTDDALVVVIRYNGIPR